MFEAQHKLAVFGALSVTPDYSRLSLLKKLRGANFAKFLRWLDRGGLSLYFLSRVKEGGMEKELPGAMLCVLEERLDLNRARTSELLEDFGIISEVLTASDVPHLALKGFTLAPEFCSRFELRHQADIDLWIEPDRLPEALSSLATREFVAHTFGPDSAVTLAGPGDRRVSMNESVYRKGRVRRVELHVTLLEGLSPVTAEYPAGQWERTRTRRLGDFGYRCLSRADMFVFQVFHAFKHVMNYWVRPSWLYEISHFLAVNESDDSLWEEVWGSIGEDPLFRDALGLVIDLTRRAFGCRIPPMLQQLCVEHLPARVALWNEHFGEQFVLAELYGDKASLFVQEEFVRDAAVWRAHVRTRLLPVRSNPALSEIRGPALPQSLSDRWNKISLLRMKAAFHLKSLARYSYQSVRWRVIQRAAEL
jgi:hypothetical protein